jgi:hypothetical protein
MPHTFSPRELVFIEEVAQDRVKFNRIFQEQTAAFRINVPEYFNAMARFKESGKVAEGWVPPSPETADECIRKCDEICKAVPLDFDE